MLFNTPLYILFLIVVVTIFYFLPKKINKWFFLAASYIFYGYWDWRFLLLLMGSTLMDYYFGALIFKASTKQKKKAVLFFSVFVNLVILGFFKYFNFFVDSFGYAFGNKLDFLHIHVLLPVGISFYTFQSLSYTIDIYREKLEPTKSLLDYCLFVGIFPHMVSGPIVRARDILPQLAVLGKPVKRDFIVGFSLITVGMFQKVLIGDTASKYVDHLFSDPKYYSSGELLFSLLMFAVQIYADFAGYSNIARGSAKLFGVDLIDNFNQPFFSRSITEFWRRWHISLSSWFYDYLFNPLVLSFRYWGKIGVATALMITFLLSGLWHGAGSKFIIFGGLHGLALVFEFYTKKARKKIFGVLPKWLNDGISMVLTFAYAVFTWLFFRADDTKTVWLYLDRIFVHHTSSKITWALFGIFFTYFIAMIMIDFLELKTKNHEFLAQLKPAVRYGIALPVWIAVILYMYTLGKPTPFIYFQF
jgi:alginate O-acetyltransferase complex protein AlgI